MPRRPMTKAQLAQQLARQTNTSQKTATAFLNALTKTAIAETKKAGIFVIPGLGRLEKVQSKARMGRFYGARPIPQTVSRKDVRFYVARAAKEYVLKAKKKKKPSGGDYPGPLIED